MRASCSRSPRRSARVLERVHAAARRRPCRSPQAAGRVLAGGRPGRRRPAAFSELGDGRLRVARRGHAGTRCRSSRESPPARPRRAPLGAGEAMAIATGGVVPDGADAVIPLEHVVESDNEIEIPATAWPRATTFARAAVTFARATWSCRRGTRLGRRADRRARGRRCRRAVVCRAARASRCSRTGTELRQPGEPLGPGEIYEANGILLATALASAGAGAERLPAVADDEAAHREALERALEADVRRHFRRRVGRAARPRPADPRRARRRGGLLGRRRQAGQAARLRRARRDARLRPARQSRFVARRRRALRPPRAAGAAGRARAGARRSTEARSPRRCAGTLSVTSSCARARARRMTVSSSSRSPVRSRT